MANTINKKTKGASKIIAVLLASLFFTGCVNHAPAQRYYFKPGEKPSLFSGELNGLSGDIKITLDGVTILEGKFPRFSESLKLKGDYKGNRIFSHCKMVYCTNSISCFIYINDKPATLLEFGKP